ncbi:MAG: phosphatase PAP2 family protein [Pseudomonadota bacterium]
MDMLGPRAQAGCATLRWAEPGAMLALALLALAASRYSDLDLWLTQVFFDPVTRRFPWREQWFAAGVLHDGARWVSAFAALALLGPLLVGTWAPNERWRALRGPAAFTLLAALLSAWLVAALKHRSAHSCPWDLSLFGGGFDYFRLLGTPPANPGPGHCLPSGHASTGFMWIGAFYAARRWPAAAPWARVKGWAPAWALFATSSALAQLVRGAHFLSHLLLAIALCWAVAWALDRTWHALRAAAQAVFSPAA